METPTPMKLHEVFIAMKRYKQQRLNTSNINEVDYRQYETIDEVRIH